MNYEYILAEIEGREREKEYAVLQIRTWIRTKICGIRMNNLNPGSDSALIFFFYENCHQKFKVINVDEDLFFKFFKLLPR